MTIVNPYPLPSYNWRPITNITPFTYRDGYTYLEILEDLRNYVTKELIPFVSAEIAQFEGDVQENMNALTEYVNNIVEEIINNSITLQDPVVASLVLDEVSATRLALNEILSSLIIEDPSDPGTFLLDVPEPPQSGIAPDPNDPGFFA